MLIKAIEISGAYNSETPCVSTFVNI